MFSWTTSRTDKCTGEPPTVLHRHPIVFVRYMMTIQTPSTEDSSAGDTSLSGIIILLSELPLLQPRSSRYQLINSNYRLSSGNPCIVTLLYGNIDNEMKTFQTHPPALCDTTKRLSQGTCCTCHSTQFFQIQPGAPVSFVRLVKRKVYCPFDREGMVLVPVTDHLCIQVIYSAETGS
jgi:hypothetical protein